MLIRCEFREKIRAYYNDHKPVATVLPNRLANHQFPVWCRPQVAIERRQEPPQGYLTLVNPQGARYDARCAIKRYNKDKPPEEQLTFFSWCVPSKNRAFRPLEDFMQAPPGFDLMPYATASKRKVVARKRIDQRNSELKKQGKKLIPYPEWVRVKVNSIKNRDRQAIVDMYEHPPKGYDKLSDSQKTCKNKSTRNHIKRYNECHPDEKPIEIPGWCQLKVKLNILPAQYDQDTLACPEDWCAPPSHYNGLSESAKISMRSLMRSKVDALNDKQIVKNLKLYRYADWFKKKPRGIPVPIEKYRQPPVGYSAMSSSNQAVERYNARIFFKNLNQRLKKEGKAKVEYPQWCGRIAERTSIRSLSELLEQPENYHTMTAQEQAMIRSKRCAAIDQYNAQQAEEGTRPVDYADWMKETEPDTDR